MSSVATCWSIVLRSAAETMSTAPPNARNASASHSRKAGLSGPAIPMTTPNPTIARPHRTMQITTARPGSGSGAATRRRRHPARHPPTSRRTTAPARRRRRVVPERLVSDLREQCPGHPEHHRDDVDDERRQQHLLVARYVKPSPTTRSPARRAGPVGGSAGSLITAHSVASSAIESSRYPSTIRPPDEDAGEQRTGDGTELHHRHVEGVRRRQILQGQQSRNDRAAGRRVHCEEHLLQREQTQQQPHVVHVRGGCSHSNTDVPIRPSVVMTISLRRSMTSARAPPHRPNTTSGTSPKMPARPT